MQNTGVLIAAAGMSSRMGAFKPLLRLGEGTILSCQLDKFTLLKLSPIVIVTGNQAERIEEYVSLYKKSRQTDCTITCIRNPRYRESEMFDTLKTGMEWLKGRCVRFFVIPVDIPLFSVETVKKMLDTDEAVCKPVCSAGSGHPILIRSELIESLLSYEGGDGLRGALKDADVKTTKVEVDDTGILMDADTPEDYRKIERISCGGI